MRNLLLFCGGLIALTWSSCSRIVRTYSETGQLQEKYRRDRQRQMHGEYKLYYSNKQLSIARQYQHGQIIGTEYTYYENGKIRKIAQYQRNLYNGNFTYYYDTGVLEQEGVYKDDAIIGKLKTYYKSGQLKEIVNFENGEENGEFIYYYPNGKVKATGQLRNGDNFDGQILRYDETTGELIQKQQCDMGECITTWQIGDK